LTADRIRVRITEKPRARWGLGLLWLVVGEYPNNVGDDRVTVTVEDRELGGRWTIPVRSVERAEYVRDLVLEAARTLSDAETDAWTRSGRWATLHEPRPTDDTVP